MKVKIIELLNTDELWGALLKQKMNGAVSLKIAEIIREMGYKLKTFHETREKLVIDNNGVLNEEMNKYEFENSEDEEKVNKEFQELVNSEVELYCRQLSQSDLSKIDIEPENTLKILWAIEKE